MTMDELLGTLRRLPHFQDGSEITLERVRAVVAEHIDMMMTWVPIPHEITFFDDDGEEFKIVYEDGDDSVGIGSGWVIGGDWRPVSTATTDDEP